MAAPTRAKRKLGDFLRKLRTEADVPSKDAATEVKTTDSTLNRYEAGQVMPSWGNVRTLLAFYGATDDDVQEAAQLWEDARDEPPPVRLPTGTTKEFRRLVTAEREAQRVRAISPFVVPGLFQTEGYVRAVNARSERYHPETRVDGWVSVRLGRQKRLRGPSALEVHAVLDEAVIRRVVGGRDVMREQLARLLTLSDQPNIMLQVVTYDAGAYGTMSGPCAIVSYPEPDAVSGVYLEYPAGGAWVDDVADVGRFTTMFEDAVSAALSPADTADLIRQQLRALEG